MSSKSKGGGHRYGNPAKRRLLAGDLVSAELLDDLTRRLIELYQGKHVDLHFLRAAIDNAIEASEA